MGERGDTRYLKRSGGVSKALPQRLPSSAFGPSRCAPGRHDPQAANRRWGRSLIGAASRSIPSRLHGTALVYSTHPSKGGVTHEAYATDGTSGHADGGGPRPFHPRGGKTRRAPTGDGRGRSPRGDHDGRAPIGHARLGPQRPRDDGPASPFGRHRFLTRPPPALEPHRGAPRHRTSQRLVTVRERAASHPSDNTRTRRAPRGSVEFDRAAGATRSVALSGTGPPGDRARRRLRLRGESLTGRPARDGERALRRTTHGRGARRSRACRGPLAPR